MRIICHPEVSDFFECPYLPEKTARYRYFFASDLSETELNQLLEKGWRKFGLYYFVPDCRDCKNCIPLRIPLKDLQFSKNQKKLFARNREVQVEIKELAYSPEIYQIYKDHSLFRFQKQSTPDEFYRSFYEASCPSCQTEYRVKGELAAVGFLDRSYQAFSSVYFIYSRKFAKLSLGSFSVLKECQLARDLGLAYYYLGYFVPGNDHMAYKNRFIPNEKFNWQTQKWEPDQGDSPAGSH